MKTFELRGIIIYAPDSEITPNSIQKARQAILAKAAEQTGGRVEGSTITTSKDIGGTFFCAADLGCRGKFVEVRKET